MDAVDVRQLVTDLWIVLAAGFAAGLICKRLGISLLVGYFVIGAVIGNGGLGLVSQEHHELEYLARFGALLLLFSVGIEFSLEELRRLSRYFLVGGVTQMLLVAIPFAAVSLAVGVNWRASILVASAAALSSTVLVFKTLTEWGQFASPHGRRAIGILLFQDVALVPLMLLIPLLTGHGEAPTVTAYGLLAGKSLLFVIAVLLLRYVIKRWMVPTLANLRSVELVTLFSLCVLGGACFGSYLLGLPPAVGALAGGLMMSGNRLTKQVDTLVLPYRESFAAVFFVTLGSLLQPRAFLDEPLLLAAGLAGMVGLKTLAAAVALKLIGLDWRAAAGMGLGLAQLGEFSFLLIAEGSSQGVISKVEYNRMLFIALGTLILTPQLLKFGLRWTGPGHEESESGLTLAEPLRTAMVIGAGPIGRQVASRLEIMGVQVCVMDLSPVNLYPFAQQGFATVTGDARDTSVLERAGASGCGLAIVSVPDDGVASQVVAALRALNRSMSIVVRCRYLLSVGSLRQAGADAVVSEEEEASDALMRLCDHLARAVDSSPP